MNRRLVPVVAFCLVALFTPRPASAQKLSTKWEELTAGDFVKGIQQSKRNFRTVKLRQPGPSLSSFMGIA